jgi:acetyl esterase/lipase
MDGAGATFESNRERDVLVAREIVQGMAATFLGENGDRRPACQSVHGDLRAATVYIQVGGYETLLDDSRALAEALRRAGGEVKLDVYPEMQHVFHFLAGVAPEADEAIGQLAAWVRPKLGLGNL